MIVMVTSTDYWRILQKVEVRQPYAPTPVRHWVASTPI